MVEIPWLHNDWKKHLATRLEPVKSTNTLPRLAHAQEHAWEPCTRQITSVLYAQSLWKYRIAYQPPIFRELRECCWLHRLVRALCKPCRSKVLSDLLGPSTTFHICSRDREREGAQRPTLTDRPVARASNAAPMTACVDKRPQTRMRTSTQRTGREPGYFGDKNGVLDLICTIQHLHHCMVPPTPACWPLKN